MKKLWKKDSRGFTLAELLIVAAIIAVLVAISIPIFTSQLEKARESTDAANLRALYAETAAASLTNDGAETTSTKSYTLTQSGDWEYVDDIAGVAIANVPKDGAVKVTVKADGSVEFKN